MKNNILIPLLCSLSILYSHSVFFSVDTSNLNFPTSDYDNIVVNGSWNDWSGWGVTLNDSDGDGIYIGTIVGKVLWNLMLITSDFGTGNTFHNNSITDTIYF